MKDIEVFLQTVVGRGLTRLVPVIVELIVGVLLIQAVLKVLRRTLEKSRLERAAYTLVLSCAKVGLYLLLILILAPQLGIDVTSIVALASVLTLAVSLALQNMMANVIGGFTILTYSSFHSGDYVEIAGQAGTVQEINMTYTKLLTPDSKVISIPNSAVVAAQIINYSASETRRVDINVSAAYTCPIQAVLDALIETASTANVLEDPAPAAVVLNYGESNIDYSLRVWVRTEDYWDVFFQLNQQVKAVFDQRGIEMSYPQVNVHIQKD